MGYTIADEVMRVEATHVCGAKATRLQVVANIWLVQGYNALRGQAWMMGGPWVNVDGVRGLYKTSLGSIVGIPMVG